MHQLLYLLIFGLAFMLWITAAHAQPTEDLKIHTVLPYDQIPAIFNPEFVSADNAEIQPDTPVIGVTIGGEAHAYSMILLNHHEIVNDVINGQPIATTW